MTLLILAVTDTMIIRQMASATCMLLKSSKHPVRKVEKNVKRLRYVHVDLRRVLVSGVRA